VATGGLTVAGVLGLASIGILILIGAGVCAVAAVRSDPHGSPPLTEPRPGHQGRCRRSADIAYGCKASRTSAPACGRGASALDLGEVLVCVERQDDVLGVALPDEGHNDAGP